MKKKTKKTLLALILILVPLIAVGFFGQGKVIYGPDNRVEYVTAPSQIQALADATAAMVPASDINGYRRYNYVCKDEPFYNQRALALCTGFLVGPDTLATAGHCIKSQADCNKYRWVFNYNTTNPVMKPQEVYRCKSIVRRALTNTYDYAVVKLDRVVDATPLKLATTDIKRGEKILVIGHPSGLPMKIADNAKVRSVSKGYFTTNLDSYGGNSGSPVFNAETYDVEGILVRGYTDFVYDQANKCRRSMRCSDTGCGGEDVTKIKYVIDSIK